LLAFALVFWLHISQHHLVPIPCEYGRTGTDLFFALSGFLITRMLLINSGNSILQEIRTFYIRRTLRIFPLYYVYLAILFFCHMLSHAPWYFCYAFNIGWYIHDWRQGIWSHLWTLSVEEQYYLVYPIILLATPARWRFLTIVALLFGFTYCNWTMRHHLFWLLTPTRTALIWGSLAAFLDVKFTLKWLKGGLIFAIGLAICLFFAYLEDFGQGMQPGVNFNSLFNSLYDPWQAIGFTLLVWGLWRAENKFLLAPFTAAPVVYLGKISYGLYVFHGSSFNLYYWLISLMPALGRIQPAVFVLLLTIAQAMISWHLLEKPMNDLKDRFVFAKPKVEPEREQRLSSRLEEPT